MALAKVHAAVRLGGLLLGLATCMMLVWWALPLAVLLLGGALLWTGMTAAEQLQMLKPWWPMAVIVLAVHTATACFAAGQLVVDGVWSGLVTLGRVMLCLGLLSFFLRVTSLAETIAAVHYWCQPLRKVGVQTRHLGLVLAVALGTAPVVLEEGKRIRAVVRMRQAAAEREGLQARISQWRSSLLEWGHLVLPIIESLGRRADALSLSLATRLQSEAAQGPPPSKLALLILALWLVVLVWFSVLSNRGG